MDKFIICKSRAFAEWYMYVPEEDFPRWYDTFEEARLDFIAEIQSGTH